jgi:hypothetical protein
MELKADFSLPLFYKKGEINMKPIKTPPAWEWIKSKILKMSKKGFKKTGETAAHKKEKKRGY